MEGSLAGAKVAAMVEGVGWSAVSGAFGQIVSVLWLLGTGVVAAWTCGREYSDRTLGQLLALPTPSARIATAKLRGDSCGRSWPSERALLLVGGCGAGIGAPGTTSGRWVPGSSPAWPARGWRCRSPGWQPWAVGTCRRSALSSAP